MITCLIQFYQLVHHMFRSSVFCYTIQKQIIEKNMILPCFINQIQFNLNESAQLEPNISSCHNFLFSSFTYSRRDISRANWCVFLEEKKQDFFLTVAPGSCWVDRLLLFLCMCSYIVNFFVLCVCFPCILGICYNRSNLGAPDYSLKYVFFGLVFLIHYEHIAHIAVSIRVFFHSTY